MQTIGERLEEARKKKGISIREAAEATKVRGDFLQKFESNHFDIGLTEIYTRGFLRTYAAFLKLPTDRILNDYAALGRGELRPRQPSREVYGRMDISVASAGEASDRAEPPAEGAAEAEPVRAQPRYPRGGSSLPTGPDPAVVFRYLKWAGGVVAVLVFVLIANWLVSSRSTKTPPTPAQNTAQATTPPPPAANNRNSGTITALDAVTVQVWAQNADGTYGAVILDTTPLARGASISFPKSGPVFVFASEVANLSVSVGKDIYSPGAPPNSFHGAMRFVVP
jgi:cytoskeletal protein RodZ